jgi:hypothetical protein
VSYDIRFEDTAVKMSMLVSWVASIFRDEAQHRYVGNKYRHVLANLSREGSLTVPPPLILTSQTINGTHRKTKQ